MPDLLEFEPLPEKGVLLAAFPSESLAGRIHKVYWSVEERVKCTCLGFQGSGKCWHIQLVEDLLELVGLASLIERPLNSADLKED